MPDYSAVSQLFRPSTPRRRTREDFETLKDVFTEDCTFTVDITGGPTVGPYEDRASTLEFIEGAIRGQDDQRRHVITNVRLAGDKAYAILSLMVTKDGELTPQATGVYDCDVVGNGGRHAVRVDVPHSRPPLMRAVLRRADDRHAGRHARSAQRMGEPAAGALDLALAGAADDLVGDLLDHAHSRWRRPDGRRTAALPRG